MSARVWIAAAALAGALLGLAAGLRLADAARPEPPPAAPTDAGDADAAAELREALRAEREESERLRAEAAELRAQVDWLLQLTPGPGAEAAAGAEPGAGEEPEAPPQAGGAFDVEALLAEGYTEREIRRLRERFDRSQMERLELRNQATREGWAGTRRFGLKLRGARNALREELGDRDYDRMLYASGRPNRVVIQDVLHDSPAERAGLASGDVIVRYGGEPVFDGLDLHGETVTGRRGATTPVDVLRDGEKIRLYVPRGPLGARLRRERRPPDPY